MRQQLDLSHNAPRILGEVWFCGLLLMNIYFKSWSDTQVCPWVPENDPGWDGSNLSIYCLLLLFWRSFYIDSNVCRAVLGTWDSSCTETVGAITQRSWFFSVFLEPLPLVYVWVFIQYKNAGCKQYCGQHISAEPVTTFQTSETNHLLLYKQQQ